MKKYLAIGHWTDDKKHMTCVALTCATIKDFRSNLGGNGFVPNVIISEKKMEAIKNMDSFERFYEVKKMTSNYRVWNAVNEYIEQCFDIMEDRMSRA